MFEFFVDEMELIIGGIFDFLMDVGNEILQVLVKKKQFGEYGVDLIQIFEGFEVVCKWFGMYIGFMGLCGLYYFVYEIVDNLVDEVFVGYVDMILVMMFVDGGVCVVDNGCGIFVDLYFFDLNKFMVEVVLMILYVGGKFGGGVYVVFGGLYGVGLLVVNVFFICFDVEVKQKGFVWWYSFVDGGILQQKFEKGEEIDEIGMSIMFWLDVWIFIEIIEFDYDMLCICFQQMVFFNKGLCIELKDEWEFLVYEVEEDGVIVICQLSDVFFYECGFVDYVEYFNKVCYVEVVNDEIIVFEFEDIEWKILFEVVMQWIILYIENVFIYVNMINMYEGGIYEEGFCVVLIIFVNKYVCVNNLFKEKDDNFFGDDVCEGLMVVILIKFGEFQFEGQIKMKFGNIEVKVFVQKVVGDQFGDWFD